MNFFYILFHFYCLIFQSDKWVFSTNPFAFQQNCEKEAYSPPYRFERIKNKNNVIQFHRRIIMFFRKKIEEFQRKMLIAQNQ